MISHRRATSWLASPVVGVAAAPWPPWHTLTMLAHLHEGWMEKTGASARQWRGGSVKRRWFVS